MRMIDADELKDQIIDEIVVTIPTADMKDTAPSAISFVNRLNMAPTIDAVPVVRCRECKHWETDWPPSGFDPTNPRYFCSVNDTFPTGDWFCKDGERREEEN